MSDKTGISWTQATWNPVTGCDRISEGCDHCLAPGTLVLRADMTWVPIASVQVGDDLVSFTETPAIGENRVWEVATVLATWETVKPVIEVELANGARFTASEDHRWLLSHRGASSWWRQTIGLNFKTSVRAIRCEPTDTNSLLYRAGYVAGVTAGDGTFRWDPSWRSDKMGDPQSYWRVAKPVSDRVVLDRLAEYLLDFGIAVEVRPFDAGPSGFTDHPVPMAKVETRKLANMPLIAGFCDEQGASAEWMAGWLAGMFDTDASYCGGNLRFCQSKPSDVLDRVVRYGKELGFDMQPEHYEGTRCPTVRLMGGIAENIAFLSAISPAMTRRCQDFYGKRIETPASRVVGMRRGPAQRLIDITTSTGTFVAEGALTHNCYALTLAARLKGMGSPKYQNDGDPRTSGPGFGVTVHPASLRIPLRWRDPRLVFVNSMSDLFHARVPVPYISQVFAVMARTQRHTYQVLTKRSGRMLSVVGDDFAGGQRLLAEAHDEADALALYERWPLPNVHLGVSVESDAHRGRIDDLRKTSAVLRFLSLEPLLGPLPSLDLSGIGWCILGGESGPGHRPMDIGWLESIAEQCRAADIPVWVKQDSGPRSGMQGRIPDDIWALKEFPAEAVTSGA